VRCGDAHAYRWFLEDATPYIRAVVRRRAGNPLAADVEDIVQDVLLALHLKRGSWNRALPIGPWISTLTRNKIIDALRKTRSHGRWCMDRSAVWVKREDPQ
jgi:RNA polymerase sigma factor (sigma-70 family)